MNTIKNAELTTGLFYDEDGTEHRMTSGQESGADQPWQHAQNVG